MSSIQSRLFERTLANSFGVIAHKDSEILRRGGLLNTCQVTLKLEARKEIEKRAIFGR